MSFSKGHIQAIAKILHQKGVEQIVISPGSRNAPLINAFYSEFENACISIVDERSAAYFALGIAMESKKPVAMLSTSGTAVLNLGPAIAEAYYMGVPIIALTADRPKEWIGQQDNQSINQTSVFVNNIKRSFELPVDTTLDDDLWFAERIINEALNCCISGMPGPVHLNIPLREPLYSEIPEYKNPRIIEFYHSTSFEFGESLLRKLNNSQKILVVAGQNLPNSELNSLLIEIARNENVVVIAEAISNIKGEGVVDLPDSVLAVSIDNQEILEPDLIIYFGGQVVSKRLKNFLRKVKCEQWFVDEEGRHVDTFKNLTLVVRTSAESFFRNICTSKFSTIKSDYNKIWQNNYRIALDKENAILRGIPFSDLIVLNRITVLLEEDDILFIGNSSIIRYMQLFTIKSKQIYSNRGTSGIDGCLSTAAGIASNTNANVIAVLGDLTFLYDSNGLWNRELPQNLKIIVVNNQGGGIFSLIDGPGSQDTFEKYFRAHHNVNISKLSESYGVSYLKSENLEDTEKSIIKLRLSESTTLLEIVTPGENNSSIFRNFVTKLSM